MAIEEYEDDLGAAYQAHDPKVDQIIIDEHGNVIVKTNGDIDQEFMQQQ